MKKRLFIFVLVVTTIVLPYNSIAQMSYEDVVYLKNGSIIHGIIIEQIPNQSIKIQTHDGNVFVYKIEEIEKMTKEQSRKSKFGKVNNNESEIKQSGFTNITELNFGIGTGTASKEFSYGIQTINGYQFNPNFNLGFGVGVDKYKNATFLPLFLDFRINFLKSNVTPYFGAAGGYSIGFSGNQGGLLLNPSLGIKFFLNPKIAFNFSFGYRYQENTFKYLFDSYYILKVKESVNLINLKVGITF